MKQQVYVRIEAKIPVDNTKDLPKEVQDFLNAIGPRDDADLECWYTNEDGDALFA